VNPDMAMAYCDFVEERHRVWEARQLGAPQPWTADPILAGRKFTNVFRVLDPGSQYIFELADPDPRTELMRLFLYRHTGRVEVWEYLTLTVGLPTPETLGETLSALQAYRGESRVITCGTTTVGGGSRKGRLHDKPVFTSAYLVFPQSATPGTDKLESIIDLTARLFSDGQLVDEWLDARNLEARFAVLRRNKGVADFMSMQILTDWGYLHPQDENSFVRPGPGAIKGAKVIAPSWPTMKVLEWAWDHWQCSSSAPQLGTRRPSLMDTQNTLCEFSKYARYLERPDTGPYKPAHPGPQQPPRLPLHW
jgi:hypothetical protein